MFATHLLRRKLGLVLPATVWLVGCSVGAPPPVPVSRATDELAPPRAFDRSPRRLHWAAEEPWLVSVNRAERVVDLYRFGTLVDSYPAVFGRRPGRKLYEGDRRTPIGTYRITRKRIHTRFHRFLDIDYPTSEDWRRFRAGLRDGQVPNPERARPGSLLGLHGSDAEILNESDIDWTWGCVSLRNADIEKIYDAVPEGTVVVIRDGRAP